MGMLPYAAMRSLVQHLLQVCGAAMRSLVLHLLQVCGAGISPQWRFTFFQQPRVLRVAFWAERFWLQSLPQGECCRSSTMAFLLDSHSTACSVTLVCGIMWCCITRWLLKQPEKRGTARRRYFAFARGLNCIEYVAVATLPPCLRSIKYQRCTGV